MKRKIIASLLAFSMVAMSLAGCGNDGTSGGSSGTPGSGAGEQSNAGNQGTDVDQSALDKEAEALGLPPMTTDEITLTYACWDVGYAEEDKAREKQLAAFKEAYPNITVEFVEIGGDWGNGLVSLAANGELPDVFWVDLVTSAVANEWALDVTEYYEKDPDAKEVYPALIEGSRLNGKLYSMPVRMFLRTVFLNKGMFDMYNEPIPSYDWTFDEFKEVAVRLSHPNDLYFGVVGLDGYEDYLLSLFNSGRSFRGWDGTAYHFDQTWVDLMNLKYEWLDNRTLENATPEEKLQVVGDENAWMGGLGRVGIILDFGWAEEYYIDLVSAETGMEFLCYPQLTGPTGQQTAKVDYSVISAATEHPREAWELQKWTSWGKEAGLNRYAGYQEAGFTYVNRLPVINNQEVWDLVKSFSDREDIKALFDHATDIVPDGYPVAPGWKEFDEWCNENEIWTKLWNREISPAEIAGEMEKKANEIAAEWLSQYAQ